MAEPQDVPSEPGDVQIHLREELRGGVWANFARVSHSPYEFTLDFARLEFGGEKPTGGTVVSRVSVSPLFILQLVEALQTNYDKWAAKAMPAELRDVGDTDPDDG